MATDQHEGYCTEDYLVVADSKYFSLAPGEVKELPVDLSSTCASYLNDDITIQTRVSFKNDPKWVKNKDQIAIKGLSFEVIDAVTGENLVDLAKSLGAPACNFGSGFVFTDMRKLPKALRPVLLRLTNNGRYTQEPQFSLSYSNLLLPSQCADYPR